MMDKRLVDPRRPRTDKPTEAERQEGLQRYSPQLQQIASLFASYSRQIPRLKGALMSIAFERKQQGASRLVQMPVLDFFPRTLPARVHLTHYWRVKQT